MSVKLRPGVLMTETEYGMALLDQDSGDYWTLNPTAAALLEALLDGGGIEQAVAGLTGRYRVSPEDAAQDIARVLDELRAAELVVS